MTMGKARTPGRAAARLDRRTHNAEETQRPDLSVWRTAGPRQNRPRPPRHVVHYVPAVSDVCRRRILGSVSCVAAVP